MKQHEISSPKGAKKARKRVGRGDSSGHGSYSGRGMKGQNARSGGGVRPNFEGGQLPITKAMPMMRGFTNIFRIKYQEVNIDRLLDFSPNTQITPQVMVDSGIIKNTNHPVKILGRGDINVPLVVEANKFTSSARAKIEDVGGTVREIR